MTERHPSRQTASRSRRAETRRALRDAKRGGRAEAPRRRRCLAVVIGLVAAVLWLAPQSASLSLAPAVEAADAPVATADPAAAPPTTEPTPAATPGPIFRIPLPADPTAGPIGGIPTPKTPTQGDEPTPTPTPDATATPEPTAAPDAKPLALTGTIGDLMFIAGLAGGPVQLPRASGGSGTLTYAISPAPPAGLTFDAATLKLGGTPEAASAKTTHTYSVTDGTDTAALRFTIEVLAAEEEASAAVGCSSLKSSVSVSASTNPAHKLYALDLSINSANGSADQAKIEWKKKSDSTWSEKTVDANISKAAIESLDSSTAYEVMFAIRFNSSNLDFGHCGWKYSDVAEATTASPAVPNKPNAPTVTQNATTPKTQLDVGWTATYGAPKVSGYFVEYKKKSETNWIQWGNEYSSSTLETTINGLTEGTTYEARVQAKNSQGNSSWSDPGEGTTQDKNVDPEFSADTAARSIAENSAADASVGSAVTATDTESDTLTYSLSGTDASSFTIDSATGQIKVGSGTTLDFESSTTSYSVTVGVSDLKDSSGTADTVVDDTITITISVTDVNEPPPKMNPSAGQQASSPKYQIAVRWQAPTVTDRPAVTHFDLRYKKKSDSTWTQVDDLGKALKYYAITGLTYKTDYQVEMRAANDEGDGAWSDTDEVKTHDQTEPEFSSDSITLSIAENAEVGDDVGVVAADDDDNDTLYYSMSGTGASDFSLGQYNGTIDVAAGLDYETTSSYTLTLSVKDKKASDDTADDVVDDTITVTINVTDVNEPPPKLSAPTVSANSTTPSTKLDVSWTAPTMTGKPAVSDYDVQYRLTGTTGTNTWIDASYTGTGTSTTLTGLTAGKKYDVQVRAGSHEGDGPWSDTGNAITTSTSVTRSVAENTAANGNVGAAVTMTPGSYTLAHTLSGTDASKFEVGATTGQITVKSGTSLDFESGTTSYSVTVSIAVSGTGNSNSVPNGTGTYTVPITINVTDVNEPPPKMSAPTVTANSTTPSTKLDVSWTAPTTTQMSGKPAVSDFDVQYRKTGDTDWTDASYTGTGTSTTLTGLTKGKSYEVQVRAVNAEGDGDWSDSGTAITDANAVTRRVGENSAAGTNVGAAVTATDTTYTYTHALSGTDASKFEIGSSTGQITVKSGTSLDYETKTSYSVTVTVAAAVAQGQAQAQSFTLDPNAPGDYTVPVTINVTDVNEAPTFSDDTATRSIAENSDAGANIGAAVTATDPDTNNKNFSALTYSLTGTDASKFNIGSSTGQITVKTGNIPDYEAKTSYSVTVNVTDGKNASGTADTAIDDTIAVTINVTDVSEPPAAPAAPTVTANSTTPTSKIDVSWTAPTMTGKPAITDYDVQYRLSGGSTWTSHGFTGTGTSTTLTGLTAGKGYDVRVRAVNAEGDGAWSASGTAITKAGGVTRSVAENTAAGGNVGAPVTATSNPNNYDLTHSLSGTDAGKFTIVASSGQIRVKSGTSLDYESGTTSYSVVVTMTAAVAQVNSFSLDPNLPGDYVVPVTISVTDADEPPPAPDAPSVTQNTATPKTKLDVSWTALTTTQMAGKPSVGDYDVQYKKSSDSTWTSHAFTGTGTSTTLTGLDEGTEYDVRVRAVNDEGDGAWSASGESNTQDKNVHAEFPDTSAARAVAENSAAGSNVGAAVTATDTENHTLYYSLAGTDGAKFNIGLNTGQITVKAGNIPNHEAKTSYSVIVEVSDRKDSNDNADTKIDDTITVTITVTDVAEPPPKLAAPTVTRNTTPKTKLDVSWTAPTMTGKPPVTDYDVQYRKTGESWTSHTFTGKGRSTTLTGLDEGTSYDVQVRATNAEGTSAWSDSGTKTTASNTPPKFTDIGSLGVTRAIKENTGAGGNVGAPVAASDPEGDKLTYSLTGTDASKFDIDSSTGQITVGSGTDLNYEAKTNYLVTVQVTDGKDSDGDPDTSIDASAFVNINVQDVAEPPAKLAAPSVSANSASPESKIDVSWTAPRMTGKPPITGYDVEYRETGESTWTDASFTGTGTSTTLTGLDDGKRYDVRVRATNDEGTSGWSTEGNAITNPKPVSRSIDENSSAGATVGAPASTCPGCTVTHALGGPDAGMFNINRSTGQITVANGTSLDFESRTSYSVTVTVTVASGGGGGSIQSGGAVGASLTPNGPGTYVLPVTIGVADVAEPPGPPTGITTGVGYEPRTSLDVFWTPPNMAGKPPVKYWELQHRARGGTTWSDPVWMGVAQYTAGTLSGLTAGTTYEIQMRGVNDEGEGEWSESGTGSTQGLVSSPLVSQPPAQQPTPSQPGTQQPPSSRQPSELPTGTRDADAETSRPIVLEDDRPDAALGAHPVPVGAADGTSSAAAASADRSAQPASPTTGHGPTVAGRPTLAESREGAATLLLLALAVALPLAARRRTRA